MRNVSVEVGALQGYLRMGYGWVRREQAQDLTRVRVPRGAA